MRRMAFFVIFLVGTIGGLEWLSQSFTATWEPRLRTYLEETAGRLSKTNVQMDSITLAFLDHVRLLNVRVSEPDDPNHPLFQAGQIELTLSLIDLPRALYHRRPYEAIGLITIENPWILLSQETLARHSGGDGSASYLPPWFTLAWEGGSFQWKDSRAPHGAWTLYQSRGTFHIRGPQMSLTVYGSIEEAHFVRLQFNSLVHRWNAEPSFLKGSCRASSRFSKRSASACYCLPRGSFAAASSLMGRRAAGDGPSAAIIGSIFWTGQL